MEFALGIAYIFRPMKNAAQQSRRCRVLTVLVVLLLSAQVLQAAHLHADHSLAQDCVQCQVDGGQAMAVTDAVTPPCLPAVDTSHPDVAVAPVATFYRLAARGPPTLSS